MADLSSQRSRLRKGFILPFAIFGAMAALIMTGAILTFEPQAAEAYIPATLVPPYHYQVTTGEDEPPHIPISNCQNSAGTCTLRAAVTSANLDLNNISQIFLSPGTYTLTYGTLPIEQSMAFVGSGAGDTIIQVDDLAFNIVTITEDGDLTILDLTLTGGYSNSNGGAIANHGEVTLVGSVVTENEAVAAGGIWNGGTLTLRNSIVSKNTALEGDGGIVNMGEAALVETIVSENLGNSGAGGIANNGSLDISGSTIKGNSANNGAGISNWGDLTLEASTIALNEAIYKGGGLYNGAGLAKIINSTLSGNTASEGGAIYNSSGASTWLVSDTLANNAAEGDGGGIFMEPGAGLDLRNTILSFNTAGGTGGNCRGILGSVRNILISSEDCVMTGTVILADPLLDDLGDNGGPTLTHALQEGSPALDGVPSADCTDFSDNPLASDQRGVLRLKGIACDIGAFEDNIHWYIPLTRH